MYISLIFYYKNSNKSPNNEIANNQEPKEKSDTQLQLEKKDKLLQHEEDLEEIHGYTKVMKKNAGLMGEKLKKHDKLLDVTETKVGYLIILIRLII